MEFGRLGRCNAPGESNAIICCEDFTEVILPFLLGVLLGYASQSQFKGKTKIH